MWRNLTLFIIDGDENFLIYAQKRIEALNLGVKVKTFFNTQEVHNVLHDGEVYPFWCLCDIDDLNGAEKLYIFLKERGLSHLLTYWSDHVSEFGLKLSAATGIDVLVKTDLFKNLAELAELVKTKIKENHSF